MKVLWVISQISQDMAKVLGSSESPFGGWVQNMLNELRKVPELTISVVGCASLKREIIQSYNGIDYYILPQKGRNKGVDKDDALKVVERVRPDIIHIEGTEYTISNVFVKMDKFKNVVSMQGILSGHGQYQNGGLLISDMMFSLKNKNFIVAWTMFFRKKLLFDNRVKIGIDTIKNAQNLLGRTLWDRAHLYRYNKTAPYYECNRLLRKGFYENEWDRRKCVQHTIFVGNGYSALKGVHMVVEAVRQLCDEFPDVQLNIAGKKPYDTDLGVKLKIGYALYIKELLKRLGLEKRVNYLGILDEKQMIEEMLKSNVYVLSSLIENSPNTMAEAMILGVPTVASYAGGAPSMATDEKEVLFYRANDPTMLACQIERVFLNLDEAEARAKRAKERAMHEHDIKANVERMLTVYQKIVLGE